MVEKPFFYISIMLLAIFIACKEDELPPVESGKVITDVDLIFNPVAGGAPLSFSASDPDGKGPESMTADPIVIEANTSYQLFIRIRNDIDNVDLTDVIEEEGGEHIIFFGFPDDVFDQPAGDGNIDNRSDQVNYIDKDESGLPIGLITGWQTATDGNGTFRIVLKYQPGIKTESSGLNTGITDLDLSFDISIE